MKRRLIGVAAAVLGVTLMGGVGVQTASAADPILETTVTLPLFGATLTLDIVNGPGGSMTSVTVTPATGNVATKLDAHKVVFESANPEGDPAKVVIKSRNGTQKVSAKAGSLADFVGPGGWSGDVFGDGTTSTVAFTIGGTDAAPTIVVSSATGAANVVGPVQTSSGDDDDEASARVTITFTNAAGDQTRSLTIKVKVESDDDDDDDGSEAKLSISLGKIRGVAGKAVGAHTWTGLLCDGTFGTFAYSVDANGVVTVTPGTGFTSETNDGKATVTFTDGERVRIKVKSDDGQLKVSVKERIRCDSPDPTTNAEASIPPDDDDDHDGDGDHRDEGHDGKNKSNRNNGG